MSWGERLRALAEEAQALRGDDHLDEAVRLHLACDLQRQASS